MAKRDMLRVKTPLYGVKRPMTKTPLFVPEHMVIGFGEAVL